MTTATTSLREHVSAATDALERAGIGSPRHDAERLAAHVLGIGWGDLWARGDGPIDDDASRALTDVISRRANGEPLAYIIGSAVFYGHEIACGPGVLVPRPETETLVDVALELIEDVRRPVVVDIGCGSGAVAIAIAVARRDASVIATDTSDDALTYTRRNALANGVDVRLARGDLFDALDAELRGTVDLVVSNPPYVPSGTVLPPDVRAEPAQALFAGPRGDELLRAVAVEAREWVRRGGAVALEIGDPSQVTVLPGAEVRNDLSGRPRVAWARL